MKDFDALRKAKRKPIEERTFALGGQTFIVKPGVRPDDLAAFDELGKLGDNPDINVMMGLIDELFETLIEGGKESAVRYRGVRAVADGDDVITADELREVIEYMIEVSTGRPTVPPSDSTGGRDSTGIGSTGDSSSPVLREASRA